MQRVTRRNQMGSFIKAPTRVRGAEVITRYTSSRCLLRNKHPASVVMGVLRLKFASAELGAGSNCMGRSCSFAIAPRASSSSRRCLTCSSSARASSSASPQSPLAAIAPRSTAAAWERLPPLLGSVFRFEMRAVRRITPGSPGVFLLSACAETNSGTHHKEQQRTSHNVSP